MSSVHTSFYPWLPSHVTPMNMFDARFDPEIWCKKDAIKRAKDLGKGYVIWYDGLSTLDKQ